MSRTRRSTPKTSPAAARRGSTPPGPEGARPDRAGKSVSLPVVSPAERRRAAGLMSALEAAYPDAHCELAYSSPHELLVATILSAQATDVGVNKATPALFARFPNPRAYAAASPQEIEPFIKSIGLFRNKAKAIHAAMTQIVERFGGQVPRTMEDLLTLRGVARKTANVVLGNAYGINEGFVVDTHVERLAQRFCLVEPGTRTPMIERRLMALFPREAWCDLSHRLIWHGRRACKARLTGGAACGDHPICKKFGTCCEHRRERAGAGRLKKT
ncbi:MAG: endonuclease III [Phycisphaerales bacterium]